MKPNTKLQVVSSSPKSMIVRLGEVGVDSGQLIICDPSYIENGEFKQPDSEDKDDFAHPIYRHKEDGSLWQYINAGQKRPLDSVPDPDTGDLKTVNTFPGKYNEVIPQYGKSPNELKEEGLFTETRIDPTSHIPPGEFSYRGISKTTINDFGGELNFTKGHAGAAVAFRSGMGDGVYEVFAEIKDYGDMGWRVKKVWVELLD